MGERIKIGKKTKITKLIMFPLVIEPERRTVIWTVACWVLSRSGYYYVHLTILKVNYNVLAIVRFLVACIMLKRLIRTTIMVVKETNYFEESILVHAALYN